MPPQEVGEAYLAIRASLAGFQQEASAGVNQALARAREEAVVPIRAQVDTAASNRVAQSFQPVIGGARTMGNETERAYSRVGESSHRAYERVQVSHDGIRARFGETLRAASLMGGGVALAYGAFSQARTALTAANELAHATTILSQSTGLSARQASAWIAISQTQGVSATQLQTSFNGLSRATDSANQAFAKAGASAQQNLGKIHTEQLRINADAIAYKDAIDKYGQGSHEAASALATLSAAQNTLKGYMDGTTGSVTGSAAAFARLGITQQQLQAVQGNLPAELDLIANRFQTMGAGTDRATLAQQLFGRGSSVLLPILDQGASGIQKNIDVATQYGATLSGPTLQSMDALRGEQQKLSLEMLGLRVRIASALEPALIAVGGVALDAMNKFIRFGSEGINYAKRTMDNFLQTPYGKEFSTIAQEAASFAGMVRDRFQHDLSRPLSFGGLFRTFTTDLTTALPRMARDFWTQLNQDLFATGTPFRVHVPVQVEMRHQAANAAPQIAGAGLFPGSSFTQQGVALGRSIFDGVVNGLRAAMGHGTEIGNALAEGLQDAVQFVAGHASTITRGALIIANAFVQTLTNPAFWLQNWNLILNLAIALFPFDRIARIPLGILDALRLRAPAAELLNRLFGPAIEAARRFPGLVRDSVDRGASEVGGAVTRMFIAASEHAAAGTGDLLNAISGPMGRAAAFVVRSIGRVFDTLLPRVIRTAFTDLTGTVDRAQAKLFDDIIGGFEGNLLGRLFVRLVRFVTSSVITGEVEAAGLKLYNSLWKPFAAATGPVGDFVHTLLSMRTALAVIGATATLAFGPLIVMWTAARGLALTNAAAEVIWTAATNAWAIATKAAAAAQFLFNFAMDANPIVLVGLAIAGLVVGMIALYQNSATVRRIVHEVWSEMRSLAIPVLHAVESGIRAFVGVVTGLWHRFGGEITSVTRSMWDYVRGIFSAYLGYVHSWINLIGDLLHGRWGNILHDIEDIVRNGLNVIRHVFGGLPGDLVHIIREAGGKILDLGDWIFNQAKRLGARLVNGVIDGIKGLGSTLKNKAEGLISGALSDLNPFSPIEHGADIYIAQPIIKGTTDALNPFKEQLQHAIIDPLQTVMLMARISGTTQGRSLGLGIATGVRAGLNPLQSMLTSAIVGASNSALAAAKRALGIRSPSSVYAEQIGKPLAEGIVHGMGGLTQALIKKITDAAQAAMGTAGSFGPGATPTGSAATGANQRLGEQMMLSMGWPASQWGALQALWTRESGWNQFAKNPSSGAYGIPQSLPATKMASAGADWMTNPATQIRWGLEYIKGRYGSPGGAWAHEERYGWYHGGGVVPGSSTQNVPIIARGGEVVFTPEQMKMLAGRNISVGEVNIINPATGSAAADEFLNRLADRTG